MWVQLLLAWKDSFGVCLFLKINELNNYLRGKSLERARERRPRRCWSLEGGSGPWSRTCSCLAWSFGQVGTVVKMSPGYSGPAPLPHPLSLNTLHFFFSFDSGGFFSILFFWLPVLAGIRTRAQRLSQGLRYCWLSSLSPLIVTLSWY